MVNCDFMTLDSDPYCDQNHRKNADMHLFFWLVKSVDSLLAKSERKQLRYRCKNLISELIL